MVDISGRYGCDLYSEHFLAPTRIPGLGLLVARNERRKVPRQCCQNNTYGYSPRDCAKSPNPGVNALQMDPDPWGLSESYSMTVHSNTLGHQ